MQTGCGSQTCSHRAIVSSHALLSLQEAASAAGKAWSQVLSLLGFMPGSFFSCSFSLSESKAVGNLFPLLSHLLIEEGQASSWVCVGVGGSGTNYRLVPCSPLVIPR